MNVMRHSQTILNSGADEMYVRATKESVTVNRIEWETATWQKIDIGSLHFDNNYW
jgi:hypothetical protein